MLRSPPLYTTGTISGLQGQAGVTGAGTGWIVTDSTGAQTSNIAQYDELIVGSNRPILIQAVVDDQHLTLQEPLPFNIPTGSHYTILKNTVSPTTSVLSLLQQIQAQGSDASPDISRTFDNSDSRLKIDFDDSGRIRFRVGNTGADGSSGNPYHTAILIDPATGNVSATGLTSSGSQASTFNTIWSVIGALPDTLGVDGDYNFDNINGLYTGPKTAGTWVGARAFDLKAALKAAAASAALAAAYANAAAASAAAAAGSLLDGQCVLKYVSATQIALLPQDGGNIVINGVQYQIPSGGVTSANFGLSGTRYYVYVLLNGSALTIETTATAPATDSAGRKIKSGDPTRRLVGMYFLDGNGQFQDGGSARWVLSYFHRVEKAMSWTFSMQTASTSPATLSGTHSILCWADDVVDIESLAFVGQNSAGGTPYTNMSIYSDGAAVPTQGNAFGNEPGQNLNLPSVVRALPNLTEGAHNIETRGLTSAGTVTFTGTMLAKVRG